MMMITTTAAATTTTTTIIISNDDYSDDDSDDTWNESIKRQISAVYQSSRIVNKAEQSIPERFKWAAPSQEVPYCILHCEF